jgi:hypothetical protein
MLTLAAERAIEQLIRSCFFRHVLLTFRPFQGGAFEKRALGQLPSAKCIAFAQTGRQMLRRSDAIVKFRGYFATL